MKHSCFPLFCIGAMVIGTASAETRVGIIGVDTSHAMEFTKLLNAVTNRPDYCADFRVTAAYPYGSLDIPSSTNRYPANIQKMREMGVEITTSVPELLSRVDVVLLETNDGKRHYEQAVEVFKSGKRVFIDKPLAATLPDIIRILDAAQQYKASFFTSSVLRYAQKVAEARAGKYGSITGAQTHTPLNLEPSHSRYFWYAIHGAEPLFALMGTGCKQVICISNPSSPADVLIGTWADGRIGLMRALGGPGGDYGGLIFTTHGVVKMGGYAGYEPLLKQILTFFKTGVVPVPPEETLEIFAFLEAGAESRRRGGAIVTLDEVLAHARQEAKK